MSPSLSYRQHGFLIRSNEEGSSSKEAEALKLDERFILQSFKNLGLTERESEVYIYLSKKGLLKGNDIAKGIRMHKSQVYSILKNLQSKNAVKSTIECPTRFEALPLEKIIDSNIIAKRQEASFLEEIKSNLIKCLNEVALKSVNPPKETFMITEGHGKTNSKIFQMIEDIREELLIAISGFELGESVQNELERKIIDKAKRSNITVRLLTEVKKNNIKRTEQTIKNISKANLRKNIFGRHLDKAEGLKTCFFMKDEEEVLFFLSLRESPEQQRGDDVCLCTNSKVIVNLLQVFFNKLWDNGLSLNQAIRRLKNQTVA